MILAKVMWDFNTGKITGLLDWQLSMVGPASMWNDGDFLSSNGYSGDHDNELANMMRDFEEVCVTRKNTSAAGRNTE